MIIYKLYGDICNYNSKLCVKTIFSNSSYQHRQCYSKPSLLSFLLICQQAHVWHELGYIC